eukprot:1136662-Pelagomonas_calceolata.AAC.3
MSFDIDQIEAPGATGYYNSAFHKHNMCFKSASMPPAFMICMILKLPSWLAHPSHDLQQGIYHLQCLDMGANGPIS